jgi:hypothetical protein
MPITVFGNVRGRVQRHYRRWSRRWATIVADSMKRIDDDGLGSADTGHDWRPYVNATDWAIRAGKARLRAASAGNKERCRLQSGLADVVIQCRIVYGNAAAWGFGLSFREDTSNKANVFSYRGGTTYAWSIWTGGSLVSSTTVSGPTLTLGQAYRFELQLVGSACKAFLDGVQVGATQTITTNQTETIHGIFADGGKENLFDNFRLRRS